MRLLLKQLISCLRPPQNRKSVAWRQRELTRRRLGHENREAKRKDHFVFNMFRVWRTQRYTRTQTSFKCTSPPPPPRPRINHAFFEQYPGASFASLGILDFRLIVTSYVSRCVSWHPLSQKKWWLKFTVSEGELVKSAFWLPVRPLLSIYWGQDILLTWSEKKVLNLNK